MRLSKGYLQDSVTRRESEPSFAASKTARQQFAGVRPSRFKNFIVFFAVGLLTLVSFKSFAATTINTITTISTASTTANYGTATSVTYTVTYTTAGGGGGTRYALSLVWSGAAGTPAGVTITDVNGTAGTNFTPAGGGGTFNITIATTAGTTPNTYTFAVRATPTPGTVVTSSGTSTLTVNPKTVTITGLTAGNKTYDGGTTATLGGTATLNGVLAGDAANVTLSGTPTGTFASANVANGINVAVSGYSLTGTKATDYTLSPPTLTANITKLALTVTGLTANNKTYNGNTTATFTGGALVGVIGTDNVTLVPSGTFANKNVGTGIVVTSTSTLGGTAAGNYSLTEPTGLAANITVAPLTITGNNVSKAYGTGITGGAGSNAFGSSGLATGETIGTVTITYGTGSAATDPVATYATAAPSAATGGSFTASNYSITYNPGNITVTAVALKITANNLTMVQGSAVPTLTVTYTGFVNSESSANLTTLPTITTTATSSSPVGSYPINASGAADPNYTITYVAGTMTVNPQAPFITYNTPVTLVVGTPANLTVNSTGGAVATYGVSPALPAGLSINPTSGLISGTPTAVTAAANYVVTATNVTNFYNFTINIIVNPALPAITYTSPVTLNVGIAVSMSPNSTGGAVAGYSVNPALPAGLSIDPVTGIISGAPTAVTGAANYVVTANNVTGNGNATIRITCNAYANATYDWTGALSTDWATPGNWDINGVPQITNYPGLAGNTDIVDIGVNTSLAVFTNYPVLGSGSLTVASTTFGNNNAPVNSNSGGTLGLTVNGTLTVTGAILQKHSATGGPTNLTNTVPGITNTIQGTGTINCASFTVGDNTTPTNLVNSVTLVKIGSTAASSLTLNISGNFVLNSASLSFGINLSNSDAQVSFSAGTINLTGTLQLNNTNPAGHFLTVFAPFSIFSMDLNNTNAPVLNLSAANAINIGTNANAANKFDFYNPTTTPHKASTVNYIGASQEIYNNTGAGMYALIDKNGETNGDGYVYQNLGFSGSGTKTLDGSAFKVNGTFTLFAGTETVTLATNNPTLSVSGNFSTGTGTAFINGTNALTIGGSFNNDGTCTFGTPLVTFNSTTAATFTATIPVTFTNVAFSGGGAKNMTTGSYTVTPTGVLTMSGNTALAAGGFLTLSSAANGSATVAAIPSGCSITGNVNVQRYISANRAYRLITSPVYTASASGSNIYSLNYLQGSVPLTGYGDVAGGFDKYGNPTLYLYRENLAPQYTTFVNSNFRGINNIATPPNYYLDVDGGPFNIPVANGFLMYYRGSLKQATLTALTTVGAASTTDTLTATGTLNQGSISVTDWYTLGTPGLGYSTASGSASVEGSNLVGNPYASSIDWDKFSNTTPSAAIYGPGVANFSYQLIPTGLQGSGNYNVYQAGTGGTGSQGTPNSNIIVSGEGFFVFATGTGASLTFTEAAKTNTQVTGSSLYMGKPVQVAAIQSLRMQLAMDSVNTDGIIVRFADGTSPGFNPIEDARYRTGTGKVSLSSLSSDNVPLTINQQPLIKRVQVPLKVTATTAGNYSLNLKNVTGIPQVYDIWLKDAVTKDSVNLRKTPNYSFSINTTDTTTFGSKRFMLVVAQDTGLAYRLLTFTANKINNNRQVQLNWTAKYEENYTNFTVERSTDGNNFSVVGGITGSGAGAYGLVDNAPVPGPNYYRLKQQDINDSITYSKVVEVMYINNKAGIAGNLVTYPNPVSNTLNIVINPGSDNNVIASNYTILITNASGIIVKQATASQAYWQGDVNSFLPGTYMIQVIDNKSKNAVGRTRFVKL